jgi:hypothetical protein
VDTIGPFKKPSIYKNGGLAGSPQTPFIALRGAPIDSTDLFKTMNRESWQPTMQGRNPVSP